MKARGHDTHLYVEGRRKGNAREVYLLYILSHSFFLYPFLLYFVYDVLTYLLFSIDLLHSSYYFWLSHNSVSIPHDSV